MQVTEYEHEKAIVRIKFNNLPTEKDLKTACEKFYKAVMQEKEKEIKK